MSNETDEGAREELVEQMADEWMTKYRALREGLEALADEMAGYRTLDRAAPWVARLRALLAPSPAEGKGERPPRKTEGTGGLASGGTIVGHAGLPVLDNSYFTPAPVSSGEAGSTVDLLVALQESVKKAREARQSRPASVVTPNAEDGQP